MRTRLTTGRSSKLNVGNSRTGLFKGNRSKLNGIPSSTPEVDFDFRILEDGDFRIAEDGNFRILE